MYANTSSSARAAVAHNTVTTAADESPPRPVSGWPADSWDVTPAADTPTTATDACAGAHVRPVVVMLGLFTVAASTVSAVMIEGGAMVWLDVISPGGSHTSPLAIVHDPDRREPRIDIEPRHRAWAARPEIRWHLARQTGELYRVYLADRRTTTTRPPAEQRSRPVTGSPSCPEPRPRSASPPANTSSKPDALPPGSQRSQG